ncbi:tRNA adenosine(34) deaminase TadA [Methylothermus subterraneus]
MENDDLAWMRQALALAKTAAEQGEVPVGAVLVWGGEIVGAGYNCPISTQDPTAHAEIVALRQAARAFGNYRLPGTVLYVSKEPCVMCLGAIVHARVRRLVYGAPDPLRGATGALAFSPLFNHRVEITGGVLAEECAALLKAFFQARRAASG